ncbi:hypothetical protein HDU92_000388 [Lobulomyces angularis]|nr:hypothetical protein HDU92_000388 [Lobulomyces angularis]
MNKTINSADLHKFKQELSDDEWETSPDVEYQQPFNSKSFISSEETQLPPPKPPQYAREQKIDIEKSQRNSNNDNLKSNLNPSTNFNNISTPTTTPLYKKNSFVFENTTSVIEKGKLESLNNSSHNSIAPSAELDKKPSFLHSTSGNKASFSSTLSSKNSEPYKSTNSKSTAFAINSLFRSENNSVVNPSKPIKSSPAVFIAQQEQLYNMPNVNVHQLSSKYAFFTPSEISAFHQQFSTFDKEGRDSVHQRDLATVATKTGESYQAVVDKLNNLRITNDQGYVSFEGFLKAVTEVRVDKGVNKGGDKTKITLHGHSENTTHTINEDEKESFVHHINAQLRDDKDIKHRFPIDHQTMQVFAECKDGLLLAKLINDAVPGTIDERVLNVGKKLGVFQMTENNNVVVNSAKAIGCSVVNIGSSDLLEGREHLILGLIWQIIKIGLSARVNLKFHPELFRLLEGDETLEQFIKLPTDQILLRWFNYHLKKANWNRQVKNFSGDVKDGENYTVLLNQLKPNECSRLPLREQDLHKRAEQVLNNADKIGCRKYLTPKTLVEGNAKLNFAFVANLFNTHPGLDPLSDAEMAGIDDFDSEGDREARAFALWLNSLGVDPFVNSLFDDLRDGLVLLQAMDKVHPGIVDWKKVNKAPVTSKFKKVENTNYVVVLGKAMKFSLVGIQGSDIVDGNKLLTLGLVWQLMREHIVQTLKVLTKNGAPITDNDIVKWANDTVAHKAGKSSKMANFKDPSLRSGVFLCDLMNGIKKGIVNYELVTNGDSDENAKLNAKYAISIARKMGATIFVLPEDIVEVKSKMILTFVGTLMALDKSDNS